jgi:hypothetical protein
MLTDFALAALIVALGIRLLALSVEQSHQIMLLWSLAFFPLGFGALTGGITHGFRWHLGPRRKAFVWRVTVLSIGLTAPALVAAMVLAHLPAPTHVPALILLGIEYGLYCALMSRRDSFLYVILHYIPLLLTLAVIALVHWNRGAALTGPWLLLAVLTTGIAGIVHGRRWGFHRHFNHNDMAHLIQMAAIFFYYRAGLVLQPG